MIKFFNVKTKETREVDTEPMIAAFYNSTDQHVNAMNGQDFGWRLAPETIKRIHEIKKDDGILTRIAASFQMALEDVGDTDILRWISMEDARKEAEKNAAKEGDYSREYEDEVRAITDSEDKPKSEAKPKKPATADSKK